MTHLENYREETKEEIEKTVGSVPVQPIIFAGSGLSIRYFSGPSWDQLLSQMASSCPKLEHNYGYYRQSRDATEMGSLLADRFSQWAWDKNEEKFSNIDLKYEDTPDIYLKTEISEHFKSITPDSAENLEEEKLDQDLGIDQAQKEIRKLREIQPHAVVTTNYDRFLENIFNNEGQADKNMMLLLVRKSSDPPIKASVRY